MKFKDLITKYEKLEIIKWNALESISIKYDKAYETYKEWNVVGIKDCDDKKITRLILEEK